MACMKRKQLEEFLQSVDDFSSPKVKHEQYMTPPHIASHLLYTIQMQHADLEEKVVLDLGSGSGMLSIGAALLGANYVIGIEIDPDAIENFRSNYEEFEMCNVDCVQADVLRLGEMCGPRTFDTVLMNPPFGTKQNSGIDMAFLRVGLDLSRTAVYSLHKTSTREHIKKKCREWQLPRSDVIAELRYNLPQTYKFHKKTSVDVAVDLWRFEVPTKAS
ncbi:rRNA N6-adenosine-methyltransferase METTL5 [Anopheles ziemanni]|uniref:rRNA N6-adenosine-methyltransferase METTL5 n=1 Tax=Anopheles coustani TaxID=139045 RepID=UPI002657BE74|nr:rRNA N6-adenosine-methyltransferase METTL5 [Anopheles coustani]XP_058175963.1 rRNA N6-adenosine-methyltransferase METTL5 [Anopheles ziemanni]